MLAGFFLAFAPLSCICIFSIYTVASVLWQNLSKTGVVFNERNSVTVISAKAIASSITVLFIYITLLVPANFISELHKLQIALISFGLLLCYIPLNKEQITVDHLTFISFTALNCALLILASDLIVLFFALELLNMLVIYSFFLSSTNSKQLSHNSALKISASCVYQFILNFFSSIILYAAINRYITVTGGANIANAGLLSSNYMAILSSSAIILAFLLKFGSGPWVFFKINIYKNLSFSAVFMYTTVYMLIVFIFFLNLIFVHGLAISELAKQLAILIAVLCSLVFSNLAFQSPNFFVFLSFSSLINITIFLLQALLSVMFK